MWKEMPVDRIPESLVIEPGDLGKLGGTLTLDVGSGSRTLGSGLRGAIDFGLDLNRAALVRRQNIAADVTSVAVQGDAQDLPFRTGVFHLVVVRGLLTA